MASSYTPSIFCFQRNSMVEKQKGESERDPDGMRACLAVTTSSASESRAPPPPHPPRSPRPAASRAPRRPPPWPRAAGTASGTGRAPGEVSPGPALPSPASGPGEARRSRGGRKRSASSRTRTLRLGQRARGARGSGLTPAGRASKRGPSASLVLQLELQQKMPSMLSVSGPIRSAATQAHFTQYLPFNEVHFDTGQKVTGKVPENSCTSAWTSKSILMQHGVTMRSIHAVLK